jgi:hypothetical protein
MSQCKDLALDEQANSMQNQINTLALKRADRKDEFLSATP